MTHQSKGCCNSIKKEIATSSSKGYKKSSRIVSREKWKQAQQAFLEKEKALTLARDELNAQHRKLPMVEITKNYVFEGTDGASSLYDLFASRRQLIVYHFMFDPSWKEGCDGCSMMVDNMGHLAHLHARNTSLVLISRAPLEKIECFKKRMGWMIPWYSSFSNDFNEDFGATTVNGETHGYSVLLLDDNQIYHTYSTWNRGVEYLGSNWSYLDITPLGRQELWENSPSWVHQTPSYEWWRYHDCYKE